MPQPSSTSACEFPGFERHEMHAMPALSQPVDIRHDLRVHERIVESEIADVEGAGGDPPGRGHVG
jgi:hypothetical protein